RLHAAVPPIGPDSSDLLPEKVESKTENTPGDTPQRRGANSPVSSIFSEFQNPKLAMKANKKGPPR
ncbi:MAG: hypothetical protein L0Z07_03495, partial [Planctomycetes bacterium]|nr:hypothetical protein [Planctomycetota bacterium]